MTQQMTMVATQPVQQMGGPGGPPEESQASQMLAQAAAWRNVAQRAHESCQRGVEAKKELERRRNGPGQ